MGKPYSRDLRERVLGLVEQEGLSRRRVLGSASARSPVGSPAAGNGHVAEKLTHKKEADRRRAGVSG